MLDMPKTIMLPKEMDTMSNRNPPSRHILP